jgi:uncharacterized protein DUF4197
MFLFEIAPDVARPPHFDPRRRQLIVATGAIALLAMARAHAENMLSQLSQGDASAGVRAALERGAGFAVDSLGKTDGFWGNDKVRIPLPDWLQKGEKGLRMIGRGKDVDDLHVGINRAAEQAVPAARPLLINAVHTMSVQDAKGILTGGDDSVTKFFETHTRAPLHERFLPIVSSVTEKIGLAKRYDQLVERAGSFGLVKPDESKIEPYVTGKGLDGLFVMIGDEERKIRADPVGTGSAILKKVFGSL